MSNFFKTYIFNYKMLGFLIAFLGYYGFLKYKELKKQTIVKTNAQSLIKLKIPIEKNELQLVSDTSRNLNSFFVDIPHIPRLLILFDGGCSVCFATLSNWKRIIENQHLDIKKIIFIGYDASQIELTYILKAVLDKKYMLFADKEYVFGNTNHIQRGAPKTFLINTNLEIIDSEDPLQNKAVLNKYLTELRK